MSATRDTPPLDKQSQVDLANLLFREFRIRCFWHSPPDLVITEDMIPFVVKGLRTHGGHRGFMLAAKLEAEEQWTICNEGFYQAAVNKHGEQIRLDWTTDSAFRFFPVQEDPEFGYCLHQADLATNKLLALAGRTEIRDFLDVLQLDREYLGLGATVWAACGKDPGYTPALLLDQANRHSRFTESDLKGEHLARPVDLKALKMEWLEAKRRAEQLFAQLPAEELGCLYLNRNNRPVTPDPSGSEFATLMRHRASNRGAWPKIT